MVYQFDSPLFQVSQAVMRARQQGYFCLFLVVENPENKDSVLDIRQPVFRDGVLESIDSYMDHFPFQHYIVLRWSILVTSSPQNLYHQPNPDYNLHHHHHHLIHQGGGQPAPHPERRPEAVVRIGGRQLGLGDRHNMEISPGNLHDIYFLKFFIQ